MKRSRMGGEFWLPRSPNDLSAKVYQFQKMCFALQRSSNRVQGPALTQVLTDPQALLPAPGCLSHSGGTQGSQADV